MLVPVDLPPSIRQSCEPCRAIPRAPGATWERPVLDADARWALLRSKRATNAIKWPKLVAGTARDAHVEPLLRRFDATAPPTTLLRPEVEATWLWLETVKASKPSDAGEQVMDFWTAADPAAAVASLFALTSAPDSGAASIAAPRRLRAALSVVDETPWSNALAVARSAAEKATTGVAPLLAYLFPEDESWSNDLARSVKTPKGFQHLLALSSTDPTALARIVAKAGNTWGLLRIHAVVPAWVTVALGPGALPILRQLAKLWPDHCAAELAYLGG